MEYFVRGRGDVSQVLIRFFVLSVYILSTTGSEINHAPLVWLPHPCFLWKMCVPREPGRPWCTAYVRIYSRTQPPRHPNWAYKLIRHLLYCENIPPSYLCQTPPHCWQNLVGVKKDGCSTKWNWRGKRKLNSIASNGELPPFVYYPQVFWTSLPNQLMEQQYSFLECMRRLSGNGCFGTFCTLGYCLIPREVPNELISPNWLCWGWVLL